MVTLLCCADCYWWCAGAAPSGKHGRSRPEQQHRPYEPADGSDRERDRKLVAHTRELFAVAEERHGIGGNKCDVVGDGCWKRWKTGRQK